MSNQVELTFDALGDPVRRRIVELLRRGPTPVGALARELPVGRPAVSKHLKVLTLAGLTEVRPIGTANFYSLRPDGLAAAREWLTEAWGGVLDAYAGAARQEPPPRPESTRPSGAEQ